MSGPSVCIKLFLRFAMAQNSDAVTSPIPGKAGALLHNPSPQDAAPQMRYTSSSMHDLCALGGTCHGGLCSLDQGD